MTKGWHKPVAEEVARRVLDDPTFFPSGKELGILADGYLRLLVAGKGQIIHGDDLPTATTEEP